jgi:hypothetical protein
MSFLNRARRTRRYFLIGPLGVQGTGLSLSAATTLRGRLTGFGLNLGAAGVVGLFINRLKD